MFDVYPILLAELVQFVILALFPKLRQMKGSCDGAAILFFAAPMWKYVLQLFSWVLQKVLLWCCCDICTSHYGGNK